MKKIFFLYWNKNLSISQKFEKIFSYELVDIFIKKNDKRFRTIFNKYFIPIMRKNKIIKLDKVITWKTIKDMNKDGMEEKISPSRILHSNLYIDDSSIIKASHLGVKSSFYLNEDDIY